MFLGCCPHGNGSGQRARVRGCWAGLGCPGWVGSARRGGRSPAGALRPAHPVLPRLRRVSAWGQRLPRVPAGSLRPAPAGRARPESGSRRSRPPRASLWKPSNKGTRGGGGAGPARGPERVPGRARAEATARRARSRGPRARPLPWTRRRAGLGARGGAAPRGAAGAPPSPRPPPGAAGSRGPAPAAEPMGRGRRAAGGAARRRGDGRGRRARAGAGTMASKCPKCDKTVYFAEKVSSLGKDWHKFCLKCERCNKTLTPGGHAEHDGKPFCHKPCYATLFGPKGVNIGGAGSYIYDKPSAEGPQVTGPIEVPVVRAEERKASGPPKGPSKASSVTTFTGEPNMCPRCNKRVYFAEKVTSLGKDWHRPCLRCERCGKTLTPGGHAEHDGQPYCHKPCYGILFGPKGECRQEGWGWGWGAPPRPAPRHLAASPRRSEHWSRGQLHLRQRPRGQSSALGRGPVRLPPACSGARCSAPGAAAAQPGPARPACRPRARCRGWRPACPRLLLWPPLALLCPHGLCPSSVCLVSLCARGPGGSPWGGHPTLPLSRPQACPTVLLLLPLPVTATATLFTVFLGGHRGRPCQEPSAHLPHRLANACLTRGSHLPLRFAVNKRFEDRGI
uniref:Cysteine rich protein 2 n=1 Tax=Canis lupus familiaris TaxID=9615 RepID=A0A8I3S4W7_CANLF